MDEIDAALDFRNVSIVANYIKDRTKNAQFIIISLRYEHYIAPDRLVLTIFPITPLDPSLCPCPGYTDDGRLGMTCLRSVTG